MITGVHVETISDIWWILETGEALKLKGENQKVFLFKGAGK